MGRLSFTYLLSMRTQTLPLAIALALGAIVAPAAAQGKGSLSKVERKIVSAVDRHNDAALELLIRVVNINSGTMNFAGVRQVGDVFRAQFDSLGFTTRWVDGSSFGRAGHLVAEHPGPGPKLLLIGHLDTVFPPESPFQKFERLDDSTARGPGVIDMKGGDVIVVYALRALKEAGLLDKMNIVVVFDGDEEDSGSPLSEARRALTDAAQGAAAALGFEDGAADPRTAVISRRSAGSWLLKSTGTPAHSSQIFTPSVGAGAVFEASRVLDEFYKQLAGEQYLTFNPGVIVGGTMVDLDTTLTEGTADGKHNVVAEYAEVGGDLRALTPEQLERAQKTMRDIVAK
jgi:glutamate carboxypeptidase